MLFSHIKKASQRIICFLLAFSIFTGGFLGNPITVHATQEELEAEAEARKSLPVQSNDIDNWPVGPTISAEAAILMDANTGVILYAKNIHEKLYPASTNSDLSDCHGRRQPR